MSIAPGSITSGSTAPGSTASGPVPTRIARWLAGALWSLAVLVPSGGALGQTLGNPDPGFADGEVPGILAVVAAVGGSPFPFDGGIGADPLENFAASWTFAGYALPPQPIGQVSITLGILDHDSASPGSQVAAFSVDGFDLTAGLNALFESHGGGSGEYNLYTLSLPADAFAALLDGSATFTLGLQGPVLTPDLFGGDPVQEPFNGAALIFASLSITPVPEPGSIAFLTLGTLAMAILLRRRRRAVAPSLSRGEQHG